MLDFILIKQELKSVLFFLMYHMNKSYQTGTFKIFISIFMYVISLLHH